MYLLFVDFRKAFGSVERSFLWTVLQNQGINQKYIKEIKSIYIYQQAETYINMHRKGDNFKIECGVRQGNDLSTNLFSCILEAIFRKLEWEKQGLVTN